VEELVRIRALDVCGPRKARRNVPRERKPDDCLWRASCQRALYTNRFILTLVRRDTILRRIKNRGVVGGRRGVAWRGVVGCGGGGGGGG